MDTLSRRQSKETVSADKRQPLTERGRRLIIEIYQGTADCSRRPRSENGCERNDVRGHE